MRWHAWACWRWPLVAEALAHDPLVRLAENTLVLETDPRRP